MRLHHTHQRSHRIGVQDAIGTNCDVDGCAISERRSHKPIMPCSNAHITATRKTDNARILRRHTLAGLPVVEHPQAAVCWQSCFL